MRNGVRYLLWLYAFSMPWDTVSMPYVGSLSRLLGISVLAAATMVTLLKGSFRKPDAVTWFTMLFVLWAAVSLTWTVSYGYTWTRVVFYLQAVLSVLMVREFVRSEDDVPPLLTAYCLGAFVPMGDLLNNYRLGNEIGAADRYTGAGVNADTLGALVVIGLPMAWFLAVNRRGVVRAIAAIYLLAAPLVVLLTGTRGAFLAALVALSIIPLSLRRLSFVSYVLIGFVIAAATAAAISFTPASTWARLLAIPEELAGGGMTGRRAIWDAGFQVFWQHPFIGAGAGAYGPAVQPLLNIENTAPHSLPVGILVEQGVIGAVLFTVLFGACIWTIVRLPRRDRELWGTVLITWLVGAASANWESVKITWLMFALIAAQSGLKRAATVAKARWPVYTGGGRRPAAAVVEPAALRAPARG